MKISSSWNSSQITKLASFILMLAVLFWLTGCQVGGWEVNWTRQIKSVGVAKFVWQIQGQKNRPFRYEIECNYGIQKETSLFQEQPAFVTRVRECLVLGGEVYDTNGQKAELKLDPEQQELRIIRQGEQYSAQVSYGRVMAASGAPLDLCDPRMSDVPSILLPSVLLDLGSSYQETYNYSLNNFQGCPNVEMKVIMNLAPLPEPKNK